MVQHDLSKIPYWWTEARFPRRRLILFTLLELGLTGVIDKVLTHVWDNLLRAVSKVQIPVIAIDRQTGCSDVLFFNRLRDAAFTLIK